MGFLSLFVVALVPILKVLLVSGVGLLIALERIDLLGANARRNLNAVIFGGRNTAITDESSGQLGMSIAAIHTFLLLPFGFYKAFSRGRKKGCISGTVEDRRAFRREPHRHDHLFRLSQTPHQVLYQSLHACIIYS
ncbi:hypothetical protein CK203_043156 [Vitis vinifera]|uniref:Uncharacterized protein n=1 Tax=Vitis vinifera TaxID=29760 RepID=A0A438H334_VITVI|nr:hypothetical protein CK203_043156 [Vitis vinifera]